MKTVEELMIKDILTTSMNTTLEEANQMMTGKHTRHILVLDDKERLMGVISDRDIKKFVSPFADTTYTTPKDSATLQIPIGSIMSKKLLTITAHQTVKICIKKMLKNTIHSLPVLDDKGNLVGIITSTNIFEFSLTLL